LYSIDLATSCLIYYIKDEALVALQLHFRMYDLEKDSVT